MSIEVLDLPYTEIESDIYIELNLDSYMKYWYVQKFHNRDWRIVHSANGETIVEYLSGHSAIGEPLWQEINCPEFLILIYKIAMSKLAAGKEFTTIPERVRYCYHCGCLS